MSAVSGPGNVDLNEFLNTDEEINASLVDACIQADGLEETKLPPEETDNNMPETQVSVKMEFSCSPERIAEPNMDYMLDDVIEICSIDDSEDEDSDIDGILSLINTKVVEEKEKNNEIVIEDDEENAPLGTVMNDHNYSSQSNSSPTTPTSTKDAGNEARKEVNADTLNHCCGKEINIQQKSASNDEAASKDVSHSEIDEKEKEEIEKFMDTVLENEKKKIELIVKPKIEPNTEVVQSDTVNNEAISNDPELFLQNVMDAVAAEDAADEAAEETLAQKSSKVIGTNCNDAVKCDLNTSNSSVEQSDNETETCSFQSTCDLEVENLASNREIDAVAEPLRAESVEKVTDKAGEHEVPSRESEPTRNNQEECNSIEPQVNSQEVHEDTVNETNDGIETNECQNDEIQNTLSKNSKNESSEDSSIRDLDEITFSGTLHTLDENVSEPMEAIAFEERFEKLDIDMEEAQTLNTTLPLLRDLAALVQEMHVDCAQFATATINVSARLNAYIIEKFQMFRAIANRCENSPMKDQALQTDPKFERESLKKLNKKDKRSLLASTDSSSSSTSSSSSSTSLSSSDKVKKLRKKRRKRKRASSAQSQKVESNDIESITEIEAIKNSNEQNQMNLNNTDAVYDDGVSIMKYLRSDVFSAATMKSSNDFLSSSSAQESSSTNTSDDETMKSSKEKEKTSSEKNNKSKKSKSQKLSPLEENDREVERLINLDGLMKRHINAGSTKSNDMDKTKTKPQTQKQKTDDILEFLEKDLAKDALSSDDSVNENEEEIITEKKYLERFNEDLKKQLLNDSSNDETHDEESDDEFAPALSDESDSAGGNRSPLVEKFLKTYNIEDSEDENTEPIIEETTTASKESEEKLKESQSDKNKTSEVKNDSKENITTTISDNSDCELLNDNFIYRKRTLPKTLEKILSEAEKRKKLQKLDEDLISLSSESSECSDAEAVDVEPAETKSRTIKPMLRPDQLQRETLKAQKSENERIRRLDKRQAMLSKVLKENPEMNTNEQLVLDYIEDTKTFVKVHPDLVKQLKPHQREGLRFMYDSVYGGVEALKKTQGSGCILAHCMGLGKTLQLIALMHTVVSYKELKTRKILVLCPKSTVMNWGDEILRWLYPLGTKNLKVFTFNDTSDINEKLEIMREWSTSKRAGCLLVGYEAFRTLVFYHTYKMRNNLDPKRLETIRETVSNYLLEPGADLVVCDEGHIIKNSRSAISLAVAEIKTQKRIVLTGTPIQNNLKEYYSMVNFIKPLFLGTEKEFANMYANPIKNGQHKDSSKKDIKVMKMRSFVLHKKLSKFVQRKEAELLKTFLPKKFEYVLFVPMTDLQNKLYERILEDIKSRSDNRGRSLITDYTCLRKIWTHPKVLEDAWKNAVNLQFKRNAKNNPSHSDDDQPDDIYDSQVGFMSVRNDWWRNLLDEKDLESILPSNKLRTMFEILRMCEENGDKCLIFSAFVAVLNVVEYFFQKLTSNNKEIMSELNFPPGARSVWEPNKDYFRLDGKTSKSTRHEMIKRFNHPQNTRSRVFLISAKAGGQGINLIGANRVIILDTSWNPSNDQQNIFRVFRLGQKKNCYIYRLLALGTMEEKVYSRSVTKQAMSFRVVDVQQIDRHYSMAELAELYTLTIPKFSERPTPVLPQDSILANLLRSFPDLVYKYHEHDSLLENKVEQELSEQDKIDAWDAYERDLQMNSQLTQMPNMEDLHNRLSQGQMPNYMPPGMAPPMAGLDLQSLLNFRSGMGQPQTSASFMNPLLHQYGNLSNQQYLEILNNLRQFTSNAVGDKSTYNSAAAYAASMYGGVVPSVSPHHTSGGSITPGSSSAAMHPLNALNDLSMYGLGTSGASGNTLGQIPGQNATGLYPATASTNMPTASVNSAANLYANAASYYDQYLQKYGYNLGSNSGQVNNNLMNNAANALSSYANNSAFQAPRSTPPQTAAGRKSSTPDLTGYRNNISSASNNVTATSNTPSTSAASLANLMPSNILPTNLLGNTATATTTNTAGTSSKSKNELQKSSSSSSLNLGNNKSYNRASSTATSPTSNAQLRHTPVSTSIFPASSNTTTSNSAAAIYASSNSTSKSSLNSTPAATATRTTKAGDPQIRVKDMGQLYANSARAASLQSAVNAVVKEMSQSKNKTISNVANNNNNNNTINRSKTFTDQSMKHITPKAATAADLLKTRSEMQIIPTTSPPGTASISKQLSEMSPSISLTAVRNNNNVSGITTMKTTNNSALSTPNSNKGNRLNTNSLATITHSGLTQRHTQPSPQPTQQQNVTQNMQAKNSISNATSISNASSNKMATISKLNTNIEAKKKSSNSPPKSPLTVTTSPNASNNNQNNKKPTNTSSSIANANTTPQKTTPSILRQQQLRKMPKAISISPSGAIVNSSLSNSSNNNKGATSMSSTNSNNTITSNTSASNAAQLIFNAKKAASEKRSFSPKNVLPNTTNMVKIIANNSKRGNQSPVTIKPTTAITSPSTNTASTTAATIIRKPLNNSGLQISTKSGSTTNLNTATKTTGNASTAGPNAFPVHLIRSNSALSSTNRSFSPATSSTVSSSSRPSIVANNATIRSDHQSLSSTVTPKIASVASLNNSSKTTIKTIPNLPSTIASPNSLKRATTTVQLNPQSLKMLQEKRFVTPTTSSGSTAAPTSAMKTAAAASTLMQQKQRLSTAGSVASQNQQLQQKTAIQRAAVIRKSQKPTTSESNVVIQTVPNRSTTTPGITKFVLERKRKAPDANSKDVGNLIKRSK